jgi:hypothetical protein
MPQRFDGEYWLACLLVHLCLDSAGDSSSSFRAHLVAVYEKASNPIYPDEAEEFGLWLCFKQAEAKGREPDAPLPFSRNCPEQIA